MAATGRWHTISLGEQPPVSVWGTRSEDGYIHFVSDAMSESRLFRVPERGGTPELVEANAEIFIPEAIPGVPDRLLVTARFPDEAVTGTGILDVETGEATLIPGLAQAFEGVYAGAYLFWVNAEEILVAARLDPIRGELTSPLVTLAEGVAEQGGFTVSQTGTLIYRGSGMGSSSGGETVGWITRSDETEVIDERLAGDVGDFADARLSPDGRYAGRTPSRPK
jgi:hypothetical protein